MATQRGVGKFFVNGVHGTVAIAGAVTLAAADNKPQSVELDRQFDVAQIRDGKGAFVGAVAGEATDTIKVRMIPIDSSVSSTLSQAKTNIKLPERLGKVTLANFGNANIDGDWHFVGGSISIQQGQPVEINMDLIRPNSAYQTDPSDFD